MGPQPPAGLNRMAIAHDEQASAAQHTTPHFGWLHPVTTASSRHAPFLQNKCGDAKALDLIMAATATGCTTLSCSWAVDSIPLSVKLNLNVRGAGCMPRAAGLQLHSSMPWRQAAAAAAVPNPLLGAVRLAASHCRILMLYPCAPLASHPQGCAPTMGLSDTNGDGLVGTGDIVKYCQKGACTSLPFTTGELMGGKPAGWCLRGEVHP